MGVDNFVRVNLASLKMIKTVIIIGAVIACINAEIFTAKRSFKVKLKNNKQKTTTCDFKINYSGDSASKSGSSVSCSFDNEDKKKDEKKSKTSFDKLVSVPFTGDASFGPATLWCPAEDTLIYGTGAYDSIVNEAAADSWDQCAQRCAEFTNDSGNAPCFSWTYNSNSAAVHGLDGGMCRLLAYMDVSSLDAAGVQSGYHKCWKAYSTSLAP